MIIIHDLVEAEAQDISTLEIIRHPDIDEIKIVHKDRAIENLRRKLKDTNGQLNMKSAI